MVVVSPSVVEPMLPSMLVVNEPAAVPGVVSESPPAQFHVIPEHTQVISP